MRKLFLFLVILAIGAVTALFMIENHVYIIFIYDTTIVKTPAWLVLSIFFVFLLIIFILIIFFKRIFSVPRNLSLAIKNRKNIKVHNRVINHIHACVSGDWNLIYRENLPIKELKNISIGDVANIIRFKALFELSKDDEFEKNFKLCRQTNTISDTLALLYSKTLMRLQNYNSLIIFLESHGVGKTPRLEFIELLGLSYLNLNLYSKLENLLKKAKKLEKNSDIIFELTISLYQEKLLGSMNNSVIGMTKFWRKIPKEYRWNEKVVITLVKSLYLAGESSAADIIVKKFMQSFWNETLAMYFYKHTALKEEDKIITIADWRGKSCKSGNTFIQELHILSLLYANRLEESEKYLKLLVESNPSTRVYALLALLYEKLGKSSLQEEFTNIVLKDARKF